MIRIHYKTDIYELSELANYRLYEIAAQIIMASGYVCSLSVIKYNAIFLSIKNKRIYIAYIQDALGRKRQVNIPLILFSGVIFIGKRKSGYQKLNSANFEKVKVVCVVNGRIIEPDQKPLEWFENSGIELFQSVPQLIKIQNLLEIEGVHCNIKRTIIY